MNVWQRTRKAWSALIGTPGGGLTTETDPDRELSQLRLDVQARDEQIKKLREEYARREGASQGAVEAAGREAVAKLLRAVAPILSQLMTLRHMAEGGREVRAADALKLGAKLEQALKEHGLERIGEVGEESPFDPGLHQRMSGGDVRDGDRVRVRFVGYRIAGETPVKALVSRLGEEPAPEGDQPHGDRA